MIDINSSNVKIVGVLNATPDSFSDGGKFTSVDQAMLHARELVAGGANIIDLGGESTRPGSRYISAEVELERIRLICKELAPLFLLSIDTYKAEVAAACLRDGAAMINDVSALRADPEMVAVVREAGCEIVLMHSSTDGPLPHANSSNPCTYKDVVAEIAAFLLERAEFALANGIDSSKIILDPGCGAFISSDAVYTWQLLRELDRFIEAVAPFPVYLGVSRKGFLGGPLDQRDAISQFVALDALRKGARYIRTHNPGMLSSFLDAATRL